MSSMRVLTKALFFHTQTTETCDILIASKITGCIMKSIYLKGKTNMKEKMKTWFKKNWMYVTIGAASAGAIALAIINGFKEDASIDPIVIDKSTDEWMYKLTIPGMNFKGKELTVMEGLCVGELNDYIRDRMRNSGLLTDEMEADIVDDFVEQYPGATKVLDSIDGFWVFKKKSEDVGA